VDLYHRPLLLNEHNIEAVKHNHPMEWTQAFDALPEQTRDRRTGRPQGLTDDERRRLATLSTLIEQNLFVEDRLVTVGERQGGGDVPTRREGPDVTPSVLHATGEDDLDGLN
jgi:hypothetical protein